MDGRTIRRLREARGWTQERLAPELGVGMRTVGSWERGETVPQNRLGMLQEIFGQTEKAEKFRETDPIRAASDADLLMELLRRAHLREGGGPA